MQDNDELIRETYRLALDTNKQMRKMRRNAFWHSIITFIVYTALLVAPVYFYMQYLSPVVDQMFKAAKQMQGTGAQANAQFDSLQEAWKNFESHFKTASSTQ